MAQRLMPAKGTCSHEVIRPLKAGATRMVGITANSFWACGQARDEREHRIESVAATAGSHTEPKMLNWRTFAPNHLTENMKFAAGG